MTEKTIEDLRETAKKEALAANLELMQKRGLSVTKNYTDLVEITLTPDVLDGTEVKINGQEITGVSAIFLEADTETGMNKLMLQISGARISIKDNPKSLVLDYLDLSE